MRPRDQGRRDVARLLGALRPRAQRRWLALGALAVLCATAASTSALAEPGAPTKAPPAAKRICVRYRVVQTPSGPAARCVAHRVEVLGRGTTAAARPGAAASTGAGGLGEGASSENPGSGAPSSEPTSSGRQGQPGDHRGSSKAATTGTGGLASQPSSTAGHGSSDGSGWGVIAIIAACALAAAALLALMRRPLLRWVNGLRA